jgi:hypothetical protein
MKQWIPLAFPQKFIIFPSNAEKHSHLCLYICVGQFCPVFWRFLHDVYSVDSDEAMKRGYEALNASSLKFLIIIKRFIASSLRFFLIVKRFIAVNFYGKTSFNASSPLLFKKIHCLTLASSPLLFKVTLPTSASHSLINETLCNCSLGHPEC